MDFVLQAIFEHPFVVGLGPITAAVLAGYAVIWFGEVYLTPAGHRYLNRRG